MLVENKAHPNSEFGMQLEKNAFVILLLLLLVVLVASKEGVEIDEGARKPRIQNEKKSF
jgi:hypothetical protein